MPLTVAFNATATDPEGEALTYLWDFGVTGTKTDTSTQEDPTYTYTNPAPTRRRSRSPTPRASRARRRSPCASPARRTSARPTASPTSSTARRWTPTAGRVQRSLDNFQVRDGMLELPINNGSMYQGGTSAKNIITQPVPSGTWTVTSKITATLTENYHQAGLRVWSDDDNWASVHMISAGGNRQFEFIYEAAGNPRNGAADNSGALPADTPTTYYVRIALGRHEPDGVLLAQRRHVHARRPAGAAEHVRQPADRPDRAQRLGPERAARSLRLDPVRPGRGRWRRHGRRDPGRVQRHRRRDPAVGGRAP